MDRYFFLLSDDEGEEYWLTIDTDSFTAAFRYVFNQYPQYFVEQWRRRKVTGNPAVHIIIEGG